VSFESSAYFQRTGHRPERILTIRLGAVGDVLTTLPALRALRGLFPQATIHHLVEEGAADVVRGLAVLDDVVVVPRDQLRRELGRFRAKTFASVWRELRGRRYDLVIDFQNLLRSAIWKIATGSKHGIVRARWQEMSPLAFDFRVPCQPFDNVVRQHGNLLSVLSGDGATPKLSACAPFVPEDAARMAETLRAKLGIGGPYVVVAPGSRWPRRSLPERIVTAGVRRLKHAGVQVLLIGGPNERGWLEALGESLAVPVSVELPLKPLFALIAGAAGIFCADSAPLHVADMFELPATTVFGPSAPELYGPVFAPAFVLRDERLSGQHSFRGKDVDYFCAISGSAVEAGIDQMLSLSAKVHRAIR
jgi:heptosyltransferase I